MNNLEVAIQINKIAQKTVELKVGLDWFFEHSTRAQYEILMLMVFFIRNAHPTFDELDKAIGESGLKRSYTPCVILLAYKKYGSNTDLAITAHSDLI